MEVIAVKAGGRGDSMASPGGNRCAEAMGSLQGLKRMSTRYRTRPYLAGHTPLAAEREVLNSDADLLGSDTSDRGTRKASRTAGIC